MLTLPELKQRLAQLDLDQLVDLLRLTPEILVEISTDYISENYDELVQELGPDEFAPEEFNDDNRV